MPGQFQDRRLVIAFLSGSSTASKAALYKLRSQHHRTVLVTPDAPPPKASQPYAQLRLSHESMLLVWAPIARSSEAIQTLQEAGAHSIFLTATLEPRDSITAPGVDRVLLCSPRSLEKALLHYRAIVDNARDYLVESTKLGHPASPMAQWIVDNAYLVQLHTREIYRELHHIPVSCRRRNAKILPELAGTFLKDYGGRVSESLLIEYLDKRQEIEELSSPQLWAFPLALRVALIARLSALAQKASRAQHLREAAFLWADRISHAARSGADELQTMSKRLHAEAYASEPTFLTALAERLQDQQSILESLASTTLATPLMELVRSEHDREADDAVAISEAFKSLKTVANLDFRKVFESVSLSERQLRLEPSGIYGRSDFATRDHARQIVAFIADRTGKPESAIASEALKLVRGAPSGEKNPPQILEFLVGHRSPELERAVGFRPTVRQRILRALRRHGQVLYIGSSVLLTAAFLAIALGLASETGVDTYGLILLGILASFPLSELAIQTLHALLVGAFPPAVLPKMNYSGGIPPDAATLVVVPTMLNTASGIRREVEKLEVRYLANRERHLSFALFSDFLDAPNWSAPQDAELLDIARQGIAALNQKYGEDRFALFHRPRVWSETQQAWIGRERKRGKLEDLNTFLREGKGRILAEGTLTHPIRFVITLDADTQLPPGTALRMIETIAHPLNRVDVDPRTGIRSRGYAIIQPRVSIALPGANVTRFTRIFSDAQGTDPYCTVVSHAQQDLLDEGTFHGKAIYDLHAFHRILGNRFPPETLLSHDLIEGAHLGVGFASDIDLLENLPLNYATFAQRQHRWIRGDWQIAAWAWTKVRNSAGQPVRNPLSGINRWRIADNLRRSFVPVASLLLLAFGWFFSVAPGVWSIVLALAVGIPAVVPVFDRWTHQLEGKVYGWQGAADDLKRAIVMIAFLPHQAWLAADAILRTLYRQLWSRRRLLEWTTAEETEGESHFEATHRQMRVVAVLAGAALGWLTSQGAFAPTFMFLGLWIASPLVLRWLNGTNPSGLPQSIGRFESDVLRRLARRTWRFFDDLVNEQSSWLPPDNSQLALRVEVAQRTSPTNIGLWLNSALSARDFGYLTADEFARRCSLTLATVARMERYEGHLFNWYETTNLQPLPPRYVSSIDSGNLLASLWVLAQGCENVLNEPVIGNRSIAGLRDCVEILQSQTGPDPSLSVAVRSLQQTLAMPAAGFEQVGQLRLAAYHGGHLREARRWNPQEGDEMSYWAGKLGAELDSWSATIDRYLVWIEVLSRAPDDMVRSLSLEAVESRREALKSIPSLRQLAQGPNKTLEVLLAARDSAQAGPDVAKWLDAVAREYHRAQENAVEMIQTIETIVRDSLKLASEIDMRFLFDNERRLFSIGYTVGDPMVFNSHYDLLASECRLTSLVAIAKGDAPLNHWFALGRPRISTPSRQALLSWSGTMFEYLMPLLYTEPFENSLITQACKEAVSLQRNYASRHGLPWGISESAYSALDRNQIYQYRAFGVPDLALNPNVDPGPVVAPYATVLALMVAPEEAMDNLDHLTGVGLRGAMGFYESIDYSRPERQGAKPGVPIYAYMAHHQGMSLLALNNVLNARIMQRRFHADPRVRAVESLLFERVPIARVEAAEPLPAPVTVDIAETQERIWTKRTLLPSVHLNSSGSYSMMVTNNGGGYSRWRDFDLTRWRSDTAHDAMGTFLWFRDLRSNTIWSPAPRPFGEIGEGDVSFAADRATFTRRFADVQARMEVSTGSGDVELRHLTINNRSLRNRSLEVTFYTELALAPHAADLAHSVFSRMFIETERLKENILIAHRRSRSPEDPPIWMACVFLGAAGNIEHETDRRAFLGRGHNIQNADALQKPLTGTTGAVLDPVFSLRCRVVLEPREQRTLSFVMMAAASREELLTLIDSYQRPTAVTQALERAWTRTQLELRHLRLSAVDANLFQDVAAHLLYPSGKMRPAKAQTERHRGQRELWKHGISGDLPILLVTVSDPQGIELARQLLTAQSYWRMRGFAADVVILNREGPSYEAPLQKSLQRLVHIAADEPRTGRVYLLDWNILSPADQAVLFSSASVVLHGHRGRLQQQLLVSGNVDEQPGERPVMLAPNDPAVPFEPVELLFSNGYGGFTRDGAEYVIELTDGNNTPAPWANVISNQRFGTILTENGLGSTWNNNSQTNRLTPWHNDPCSDPQSEVLYLCDEQTGKRWTPTALPVRGADPYRVRHGQGYSVFQHNSAGISQTLTVFVADKDPVKICRLRLKNDSWRQRVVSATYFAEWVLGTAREKQQTHIQTEFNAELGALFARQDWDETHGEQIAFLAASPKTTEYTGSRVSFFSSENSPLDRRCGAGLDPCGALRVPLTIPSGETREVVFLLGESSSVESVTELIDRYMRPGAVEEALAAVKAKWDRLLQTIQVETPLPSADVLLNRWLLYQTLSCRMWGRSATYQSGGALGFRDQLQDSMTLLYSDPAITRKMILEAASHQFVEGDVQHWWHPESGLGVRTRCSDDLLWLPWAVARYVEITGDTSLLDELVPFITGPALEPHEGEKMFAASSASGVASIREHCQIAIEKGSQFGIHGLPLIGTGDWNDGMNHVGAEGKGESVWLAWFLIDVLQRWIPLIKEKSPEDASHWKQRVQRIAAAAEQAAWDGEWYLRGYFDDGTPLGSHVNAEARIDSLPQSWAILCGAANPQRAQAAMDRAEEHLVRERDGLVLLFTPPFDVAEPHPGYIRGYPPGARENGGQYTHAALWLAQARARLGQGREAVRLLKIINPVERTLTPAGVQQYRGEPFAVAADVSSSPLRVGAAGWTWYTGSAGWMYRVWLEDVLGFQLRGDRLLIRPSLPEEWKGCTITYRYHDTTYRIVYERVASGNAVRIEGKGADGDRILLRNDQQQHEIRVSLGSLDEFASQQALLPAKSVNL